MKLVRILSLLSVLCALAVPLATTAANADPTPSPSPSPSLIGWRQLGQSDKIVLLGANQSNDVELPLPSGAAAVTLAGQIGSVVNIAAGRVDILDSRGISLGSIPVPVGAATVPFTVDTSAAAVTNGAVKLSFVLRDDDPPTNSCGQLPSVTLTQLVTAFSGQSLDPTAISDFRPGYLSRIVIRVGPDSQQEVQQAALTMVARLSALYRPIPVRIDVDTSAEPPPAQSSDSRLIEIKQGPEPGMAVRDAGTPAAALVITGRGAALQNQVALFTDRRVELAQTPTATVTAVTESVPSSTRTLTFAQLGMASQISVLGTSTLYSGFDATDFGAGPIQSARLHLIARYTPVTGGEGSIMLRSGSTVLATRTLDATGILDLNADVPSEAISSKTSLALDIQYIPRRECAPLTDRLTFVVDPGSTISVTPGTGNRGGFPAMPMALTPEFNVALGNADLIRYAAQAINLMGQSTGMALRPMVRPFSDAVNSSSPLLLVADGQQMVRSGLKAPIQPGGGNSVSINGDPVTAVNLNGPLGVIQAFTDRGRTVLAVSGNEDWSLVDRSFDYIRGQDDAWASLSGDVVATGAKNVTVNLTVREGGPMAHRPSPGAPWRWWVWLTLAVAAASVVAVSAVLLLRRRRRDRT
jgi:hypothetical protein